MDGAKAYLTSCLLWDPLEDADKLLDEFYYNFFGPAAEPIRNFYELAERHRDQHVGKADWIKFYLDEASIELMRPELLDAMQACVEQASIRADASSRFGKRVKGCR